MPLGQPTFDLELSCLVGRYLNEFEDRVPTREEFAEWVSCLRETELTELLCGYKHYSNRLPDNLLVKLSEWHHA